MIILYDEAEKEFVSLGIGILSDALDCTVEEKLNDSFELSLSYPINGQNYEKIQIGRIIGAKPNPYDSVQPFRIINITKPIKGVVTITATHISYDMNGIPCKQIDANGLVEALNKIQNGTYIPHDFRFMTNISTSKTFKTVQPFNLRALLMGDKEESLLGVYKAEVKFDKFNVQVMQKRGMNRGAQVCYGYNMTDLKHETTTDKLFNGVMPYYHKETTKTETTNEDSFKQVYIVGSKPFQNGWLSYTKDGEPYHPLDNTPVQIATEGEYYEKVYAWDDLYLKYTEKIYNEQVTIIEGVMEPSWIMIDWKTFPVITCRANASGYFKSSGEGDWSELKGPGDVIFEGNILKEGLTGLSTNMIIYYSEVIPTNKESTNKEVTEAVDVTLDDPIIWINTPDARNMRYNNILSLDLTSEFDEEPTKDRLKAKAEEFISEHQLGSLKHNTTVSFIDLTSTTEADRYTNFEHVELGDAVRVIYRDLGVDTELRVISTRYNVLTDQYIDVELGEKDDTLSSTTIQNGDRISSLTNDVGYSDTTTVNRLIAKQITADFLQAVNAKLSKAQIEQLQVEKIDCKGIIEASQFTLDELVAKLLIADNAKIAETLEAGNIKVAGDIRVNSGKITISGPNGTQFIVDEEGNVTANSVSITGGTFNINDGVFEVQNDGTVTAKAIQIVGGSFNINNGTFEVLEDGTMIASKAVIKGEIEATSGKIGDAKIENGELIIKKVEAEIGSIAGFTINANNIQNGVVGTDNYIYIGTDKIKLGTAFEVTPDGKVSSSNIGITGGQIGGFEINENSITYANNPDTFVFSINRYGASKFPDSDYTYHYQLFPYLETDSLRVGEISEYPDEGGPTHKRLCQLHFLGDGMYLYVYRENLQVNNKFVLDYQNFAKLITFFQTLTTDQVDNLISLSDNSSIPDISTVYNFGNLATIATSSTSPSKLTIPTDTFDKYKYIMFEPHIGTSNTAGQVVSPVIIPISRFKEYYSSSSTCLKILNQSGNQSANLFIWRTTSGQNTVINVYSSSSNTSYGQRALRVYGLMS